MKNNFDNDTLEGIQSYEINTLKLGGRWEINCNVIPGVSMREIYDWMELFD